VKKASKFFSEEERSSISLAVTEAERKTSGEIVPVIATMSGRYDRAEDLFGLALGVILLVLSWVYVHVIKPPRGDWSTGFTLDLPALIVIVVGGFIVGVILASYIPVLRRLFLTRKEMREEVGRAAIQAFHNFHVRKTAHGTGIIIYISLYERMVHVLGDEAIAQKISQEDWNSVRNLIIEGIRNKKAAEGLRQAILQCGALLAGCFPIRPDDVDELSNEIRIID
jgi:putative membrane protein